MNFSGRSVSPVNRDPGGMVAHPGGRAGMPRLVLVGTPNVGKSALFNALTGIYVTVSNYPGTTVEVARGRAVIDGTTWEVIDTPGLYSLLPITEEERVARTVLLWDRPDLILHVVEARNLTRLLSLTLQLLETGLPLILVVNVLDEAERLGIRLDLSLLQQRLGVPVVGTVAAGGRGLDELKARIASWYRSAKGEERKVG